MSPLELVAILALTGYAIYKQTRKHEVVGSSRFKLAIIYIAVGLIMGGIHISTNATQIGLLLFSMLLSVVVGLLRGRYTRLWAEDGRVFSQGTALTVGLFIGLVAVKFALGTVLYLTHIDDDGGFGEVLLMIGIMVAFQAELIWRRAKPMGARATSTDAPATVPSQNG